MEGRDFIAVELGAHLIDFFSPDAMFPTDAAANFNAEFEDLPTKVITLTLPEDIAGEYTVTLKSGGEVLEERKIVSGTVSTQFEVSGEGIVKYEFWIAGNLYMKESVDFSEDE